MSEHRNGCRSELWEVKSKAILGSSINQTNENRFYSVSTCTIRVAYIIGNHERRRVCLVKYQKWPLTVKVVHKPMKVPRFRGRVESSERDDEWFLQENQHQQAPAAVGLGREGAIGDAIEGKVLQRPKFVAEGEYLTGIGS